MKLIESKAEYIPQEEGLEGIYKQIELAGRTAYKSEDKMIDTISIDIASLPENINIEDIPNYKENQQQCIEYLCNHNIKYQVVNSAKDFVSRMIKSKHGACLEHGTVYLFYSVSCYDIKGQKLLSKYESNPYSKVICVGVDDNEPAEDGNYYNLIGNEACGNEQYVITTNYRILVENNWLDDLQYLCSPTEFHEKRYTMRFTCSRAIANELVRSRTMSFLQESTRYINYSKERHGGELTLIVPDRSAWYGNEESKGEAYWSMLNLLDEIERVYMQAIECGVQPQIARDILPNATKTELIVTGFASDWARLFELRLYESTGKVAPDMKVLMQKAWKEFENYGITRDLERYIKL